MGKSSPAPPEPPDYSEATREGIFADIESLPARRRLESAYRLGQPVTYTDPRTGKEVSADFTGLGDIDITRAETEALLGMIPKMSDAQLSNLIEYGPQYIAAQRDQMRQLDPEGFGLREEFAGRLRRGEGTAGELTDDIDIPEYEEIGAAPVLADAEMTAAGRRELETQLADQLMRGEQLTAQQQRMLEQGVRKAGASRGQALGAASGLREAIAKLEGGMQLGQQRRGEYLGFLGSGQSEGDVANRLAQQNFANTMQRVQQINQSRGEGFAAQQQALGTRLAGRQQDVGNIQSLLGLQPVGWFRTRRIWNSGEYLRDANAEQDGADGYARTNGAGLQCSGNRLRRVFWVWREELARVEGLRDNNLWLTVKLNRKRKRNTLMLRKRLGKLLP